MTMLASSDFEKYVAQQTAKNQPVVFDQMIFCNISGLTADNLQNYLTIPAEIVHRVDISRAGYIDENKVVYSAVLGSNVGDFEFNYIGLINKSENILAVACFTDTIKKRKNKGKTYGNSMTRNIILHFSGAKALTQINIAAESWQVDFTNEFVTINNKLDYLSSPAGFGMVGQCESIEQLRTIEPTEHNQRILVRGYYAGSNVGGGEFYADLSDNTTPDNAGTVIVTNSGKRWKRVHQEIFHTADFGLADELASLKKINVTDNNHRISISSKLGGIFKAENKTGLVEGAEDILFSAQNAWMRESRNYVPYADKNRRLYSEAYRNLLNGAIRIVCVGDSMTYGYDEQSEDKLPPLEGHTRHRAPVNYPEQMQKELNRILGNENSVVINYGFSGDTAQTSFERETWRTNPQADLAIIKLGLNDRSNNVPIETYMYYLSKWVERLLDWHCAVVIATSTMRNAGADASLDEAYRQAATQVAKNYGCQLVDTSYFVDNFAYADVYSDGTHFNKHGYTILGNTMAWALLNNFQMESMSNGYLNVSRKNVWHTAAMQRATTDINNSDARVVISQNQQVSFVFYTNNDVTEIGLNGQLVGGVEISFDSNNLRAKSYSKFAQISTTENQKTRYNLSDKHRSSLYLGRVCGRGWHCVTIKSVDNATYPAYVMGLKIKVINDDNAFYDMASGLFATEKASYVKYDPAFKVTGALPPTSKNTEITLPVKSIASLVSSARWFLAEIVSVKIYATKLYDVGAPWFHSYTEYRLIQYNNRVFIEPIIEKMIAGGNVVADDVIVKLTNVTLPKRGQSGDAMLSLKRDMDCYVKIVIDNDISTGLMGIEG